MLYQRINCFLEVASCLSFSVAAQNLYISQQAVTKQIAALEKELGVQLFYRTTRSVVLTPAGSLLRDDFSQINRQISDSIRRAREIHASGQKLLRIGFLSALSRKDIILPVTDFLHTTYPEWKLEIRLLDFVELRNQLLDGKIDFCVTTSNDYQLWPDIQATVLRRKQFQVVYSRRHPLAEEPEITLDALGQYTQLVLPNENLLEGIEQWAKKIPYKRAVFCPDISSLMVHLELGEGFSLLTKVVDGHENESLRYWDVPFPEAHAEIVGICREQADNEIKRMIQLLKQHDPVTL